MPTISQCILKSFVPNLSIAKEVRFKTFNTQKILRISLPDMFCKHDVLKKNRKFHRSTSALLWCTFVVEKQFFYGSYSTEYLQSSVSV